MIPLHASHGTSQPDVVVVLTALVLVVVLAIGNAYLFGRMVLERVRGGKS